MCAQDEMHKKFENVVSKHIEAKLAESMKGQKFVILIDELSDVHVRPHLATCYIFFSNETKSIV